MKTEIADGVLRTRPATRTRRFSCERAGDASRDALEKVAADRATATATGLGLHWKSSVGTPAPMGTQPGHQPLEVYSEAPVQARQPPVHCGWGAPAEHSGEPSAQPVAGRAEPPSKVPAKPATN